MHRSAPGATVRRAGAKPEIPLTLPGVMRSPPAAPRRAARGSPARGGKAGSLASVAVFTTSAQRPQHSGRAAPAERPLIVLSSPIRSCTVPLSTVISKASAIVYREQPRVLPGALSSTRFSSRFRIGARCSRRSLPGALSSALFSFSTRTSASFSRRAEARSSQIGRAFTGSTIQYALFAAQPSPAPAPRAGAGAGLRRSSAPAPPARRHPGRRASTGRG